MDDFQPFKNLTPKYSFPKTDELLKEFEQKVSQHDKGLAAKIQETAHKIVSFNYAEMENKIYESLGIPPAMFDGSTSTYSSVYSDPSPREHTVDAIRYAMNVGRRLQEEAVIETRLPSWIVNGRMEVAQGLWVAEKVFERNLIAVATKHRMRIRWR